MSDEDIKRWIEMETLRLGLQWPGVTRVSGGAFSLWLLLGMRMLEDLWAVGSSQSKCANSDPDVSLT